ncbi:MAG: hypothetical protein LBD10_14665 [Desulfobulbus sp.]|jgi:hypothetical protein|uniref:hypothetical protein n=1 Tax=Desulfobulbus sp. TaxID=895 RepID=UPI0028452136|nr:hypothetical protein [Desulfobulbus sp.]MDR2551430.1 hypothetical protein [Desulfobulbus sp.]
MNDLLSFKNDGTELVATNYWQSEYAAGGYVYLTINAGCFRLLIPPRGLSLEDMREASVVLITRAPWPEMNKHDALEILFEDNSDAPFCLHIVPEQADSMPAERDRDRPGQPPKWTFAVYTEQGKQFELPVRYRLAKKLPCLKPWAE